MEEIVRMILLIGIIIVSLPIIGFMSFIGLVWIADFIQDRRFKKIQKNGLSKDEWKAGEREAYKKWLGY